LLICPAIIMHPRLQPVRIPEPRLSFEASLAACIEALERGSSVESCLAAYPAWAERLEPLLQIVAAQNTARPAAPAARTSRRGETAVLAQAIDALERGTSVDAWLAAHPAHADEFEPLLRIAGHVDELHQSRSVRPIWMRRARTGPQTVAQPRTQRIPNSLRSALAWMDEFTAPELPAPRPTRAPSARERGRTSWPGMVLAAAAFAFMIIVSPLLRGADASLPGDLLYPIKRSSEELQGLILEAMGDPLRWHVDQVERRVGELAQMDAVGQTPDPTLVAEVVADAQAVLDTATDLPPAERDPALAAWLLWIQVQQTEMDPTSPVAAALAEPFATVESALAQQPAVVALMPAGTATPAQVAALLPPAADGAAIAMDPDPAQLPPTLTATPLATPTLRPDRRQNGGLALPTGEAAAPTATSTPRRAAATGTPVPLPTWTQTPTATPTVKSTATRQSTTGPVVLLPTVTNTPRLLPTATLNATATFTPTASSTPTRVLWPTVTPTSAVTNTPRPTATFTTVPTATPTLRPVDTTTPTATATNSPEPTAMPTLPPTATQTTVPTEPPAPTATATPLPTMTHTPMPTATATALPTDTPLPTATHTPEPTATPTLPPTVAPTSTPTPLPTATSTPVPTATPEPPVPPNELVPDNPAGMQPDTAEKLAPTATPTSVPAQESWPADAEGMLPTAEDEPVPTETPTALPTETPGS
jgi:hypothetical protein